jgi:hypothetical protein
MWMEELENLKEQYIEYKEERNRLMNGEEKINKKKVLSKGVIIKKPVKKEPAFIMEE